MFFSEEGSAKLPVTRSKPDVYFMIVTLSNVTERILPNYEASSRSSKRFFHQLKENGHISILDGPALLPILRSAYRKLHILPTNVDIHLVSPPLAKDNVYIGVISAAELKRCYDEFGDALFLENLRGFLGYTSGRKKVSNDRENVNAAIIETAENNPEKMLARNNGITFRAEKVNRDSNNDSLLRLDNASIVNGCQTTMCLVRTTHPEAFVMIKIVETSDSWDIAKSANFQNRVEQIELELARYVRPQVVKGAASKLGVHVEHSTSGSVFDVLDHIYQDRVTYDGVYYLFIGLFSKTPNNVLYTNYTDLRSDLLEEFQLQDPRGEETFDTLFQLYKAASEGREKVESIYTDESYKSIFQRFSKENKPDYHSFLTILATCACNRVNIYSKLTDFQEMTKFLRNIRSVLENEKNKFARYYQYAFEAIAASLLNSNKDQGEIIKAMYDDLRRTRFENLYRQTCLFADGREPR